MIFFRCWRIFSVSIIEGMGIGGVNDAEVVFVPIAISNVVLLGIFGIDVFVWIAEWSCACSRENAEILDNSSLFCCNCGVCLSSGW